MPKHYTIPIFTPELACPFQCVFCNQEKISGKTKIPNTDDVKQTIESYLKSFKVEDRVVEVGFFGGSFTGNSIEQQKAYLKVVRPYIESGKIQGIRLSTRPDYINDEILNVLAENNVTSIELGAQSFDDDVLRQTRRGHTALDIEKSSEKIKKMGFNLGLQMMIGLPGDTLEKSIFTAKKIIAAGAVCTRLYPSLVIKDTLMHRWYEANEYKPLRLQTAVAWTKQILPMFEDAGVNVLRVGLHPSDGLVIGKDLVDGPFHGSFKELVITAIWTDMFSDLVANGGSENIEIHVPAKELNYAIGHKSINKNMLLQKFNSVTFIPNSEIKDRSFFVK